jgi:hypothetical protein
VRALEQIAELVVQEKITYASAAGHLNKALDGHRATVLTLCSACSPRGRFSLSEDADPAGCELEARREDLILIRRHTSEGVLPPREAVCIIADGWCSY